MFQKDVSPDTPAKPRTVASPLSLQVCFNMGQMVLAKKMLRKALKLLNRPFPYNMVSVLFHTRVEKNKYFYYMNQQAKQSSPPG